MSENKTETFKTPGAKKETLGKLTEKPIQNEKGRYPNIFIRLLKDVHLRKKIIFFTVVIGVLTYLFWGLPLPTTLGQQEPVSKNIFDRYG